MVPVLMHFLSELWRHLFPALSLFVFILIRKYIMYYILSNFLYSSHSWIHLSRAINDFTALTTSSYVYPRSVMTGTPAPNITSTRSHYWMNLSRSIKHVINQSGSVAWYIHLICLKSNFNRQLEAWPLWIRDWIHRPTSDIRNVFQKNRRQTPQKHFARQFIGTLLHCMKWNFRYRTYFILSHKDSDKIQFTNINHVQANSYRTPRS